MAKKPKDVLSAVERREKALRKHWLDDADKIIKIYEADEDEVTPFNILYSNTETILPALYNSTPRPEVARRYTEVGPSNTLDSVVAQVSERTLEYSADSNIGEYQNFDAAVRSAVLKGLVPGQGVVRVRYKEEGRYQEICYDCVAYDRFIWGYARKWVDVPWVAFGHDLNKADFEETFPEFARTKEYKEYKWEELDSEESGDEAKRRDEAGTKKEPTMLVWEVWTAAERTIKFVTASFGDRFLKEEDYPFALTMRFPMAEPFRPMLRNDSLTPIPPYKLYESQAKELNEVTRRLHIVLKAIKVRGGYNGQLAEIGMILDSDDTTLIPVENASQIAEAGGFDKHIWLMPIAELMAVAKELYQAQISAKTTIYEIMGIGDVLRGSSQASETAKAQEIKNQWGSLRIKRMQKDVMIFCRDLFRVTMEFAANLYTPATFAQITKIPLPMQAEKQQLLQMKQQIEGQMQQAQAQGGQPPQMPPVPPEVMQKLELPTWEEVVAVLKDRFERSYRIDIETNSTVDLEATEDKAQIAEFMNAWGQMMSGLTPLVENGSMPFEAAKLIMGEILRRFRFARRVERALDQVKQPQPKEDPKVVEERHKSEIERIKAESARKVQEMQETVIEMTSDNEQLKIENFTLKQEQRLAGQEVAMGQAKRENELKQDHAAKAGMMKEQMSKMQDQQLLAQIQQMIAGFKQEISQTLAGVKQEQAAQQQVAKAQQDAVAAKADAPMQAFEQVNAALTALAENQSAMMQALQQVAQMAGAEREAELVVGPDGVKRSRSRIVTMQ